MTIFLLKRENLWSSLLTYLVVISLYNWTFYLRTIRLYIRFKICFKESSCYFFHDETGFFFPCISKYAGLWWNIDYFCGIVIEGSIFVLKDNRNKIGCWLDDDAHTHPIKLYIQLNHYSNFKWHFLQTLTNWSLNS